MAALVGFQLASAERHFCAGQSPFKCVKKGPKPSAWGPFKSRITLAFDADDFIKHFITRGQNLSCCGIGTLGNDQIGKLFRDINS